MLTDKQLLEAWDNAFDSSIAFYHKPTAEDILLVRIKAVLKAQRGEIKKELEDFICDDCSTPNFIHIVVTKDYWNRGVK